MSRYLQTSTANPYGHRPWATRLYTEFEDYAFLKQPQNRIIREDVNMRPEIYRPPEMKAAGLGDVTIVGGSGRILGRARRRTMLGLVPMVNGGAARSMIIIRPPMPPVSSVPICSHAPPPAGCMYVGAPTAADPCRATLNCPGLTPPIYYPPAAPPIAILPPSIVPPVPRPIFNGPGGVVYALPGDATTPGSPFAPAPASQLPLPPGAVPVASPTAAAAATPAISASSLSDWFNAESWISGVKNGYVALGGVGVLYLFAKKKR